MKVDFGNHVVRQVCLEEDFDGGGGEDDDLLRDFPDAPRRRRQKWVTMMFCFKSSVDIIQPSFIKLVAVVAFGIVGAVRPHVEAANFQVVHYLPPPPPARAPVRRLRTSHDESALRVYYIRSRDSAFFIRMEDVCCR